MAKRTGLSSIKILCAVAAALIAVPHVVHATGVKPAPGGGGGGGTITTSSPLSGNGSAGTPATIVAGALNLNILASINNATILGNNAGISGPPLALTASQAWGVLGVMPAANHPALTGAVTSSAGSLTTAFASIASGTILGNNSGSTAAPGAITYTPPVDFVTTLGSSGQDILVSGLSGDTDGDYEIDIYLNSVSAGIVTIQPNGLATNQKGTIIYNTTASPSTISGGGSTVALQLQNGDSSGVQTFHGYISSKTGRMRTFQFDFVDNPDNQFGKFNGIWTDTATAITSLNIHGSTGTAFSSGSFMRLRALHKAN